jgi:hypothetical protein
VILHILINHHLRCWCIIIFIPKRTYPPSHTHWIGWWMEPTVCLLCYCSSYAVWQLSSRSDTITGVAVP